VIAGCVAVALAVSEVCPLSFGILRRSRCTRGRHPSGIWQCRRVVSAAAQAQGVDTDVQEAVQKLRAREIKDELISLGVDVSDAFDKDELVARLVHHRMAGTKPAEPRGEEGAPATSSTAAGDFVGRCRAMSVAELRDQLGRRQIRWADLLDKEDLVERLAAVLAEEANFSKSGRFTPGQVVELSGSELEEELVDGSTPILLDVYAQWCGPCKFMAPELEKAAKTLGQRIRVAKLDADKAQDMSSKLRVGGLPTLILFDRAGVEVARQEGAMNEAMLLQFAEQAGI